MQEAAFLDVTTVFIIAGFFMTFIVAVFIVLLMEKLNKALKRIYEISSETLTNVIALRKGSEEDQMIRQLRKTIEFVKAAKEILKELES